MGEIIHGDYRVWANDEMLDSVTNYECWKGIYSSHNDKNYFEIAYSLKRQFGQGGLYENLCLYNFLDNHDVNRIGSLLKQRENLKDVYKRQPLNRAGLLKSGRGAQGGYRLAKNTTDYTVGEILRAIEGSFAPISCLEDEENQCENYDTCATIEFWEGLYKVVNEYLDRTTLYDLVEIQ